MIGGHGSLRTWWRGVGKIWVQGIGRSQEGKRAGFVWRQELIGGCSHRSVVPFLWAVERGQAVRPGAWLE